MEAINLVEKGIVEIENAVAEARREFTKLAAGNKSAGARVRKAMQDIKTTAHEVRKNVSEVVNAGSKTSTGE